MPHRRIEEFLLRRHVQVENVKAYALLGIICLIFAGLGYLAGRIDGRDDHRAEIDRLQVAHAALLLERGKRIEEQAAQIERLTRKTTEAATTAAEAARAATTAAEAATPTPTEGHKP